MTRTVPVPRRRGTVLVTALLIVAVVGIAPLGTTIVAADSHEHTVTVIVVDENDEPVEGASVSIDDVDGDTGSNGAVSLDVAPGAYTVESSAPGYLTASQSVTIDEDRSITVELEPADDLEELRAQVDELRETIDSLEEDRDRLEAERDELAADRDRVRQDRDDLERELEETDERIAEMERQVEELNNQEGLPGFGPVVAIVAALAASVLAIRRR